VLEATATYHQMSLDDLISKRRNKEVVRARHIAIYLAREATSATLPQIGDALGGRDHSTVLHGYQKIADDLNADPILRREVNDIRRQLNLLN
jgi:chromosomal replication initiator protein